MRIEMTKRKGGIYCHWFEVLGLDRNGNKTVFIIPFECKTYAQAIKYWNKIWGKDCKAEILRNAKPLNTKITLA